MNTRTTSLRFASLGVAALALFTAAPAWAADWVMGAGQYTHNPETGERVTQYAPVGPVYFTPDPTYTKSGYRHTRSSFTGQGGARNLHVVEEWGKEVRPYGEWQFPFRPYSVPYQLWGEPYAGLAPDVVNYGPVYPQRGGRPDHRGQRPDHGGGHHGGDHHDGHGGGGHHGGDHHGGHGGGGYGPGPGYDAGYGYSGGYGGVAYPGYLPFGAYPCLPPAYGGIAPPPGVFDDYQFIGQ